MGDIADVNFLIGLQLQGHYALCKGKNDLPINAYDINYTFKLVPINNDY